MVPSIKVPPAVPLPPSTGISSRRQHQADPVSARVALSGGVIVYAVGEAEGGEGRLFQHQCVLVRLIITTASAVSASTTALGSRRESPDAAVLEVIQLTQIQGVKVRTPVK